MVGWLLLMVVVGVCLFFWLVAQKFQGVLELFGCFLLGKRDVFHS